MRCFHPLCTSFFETKTLVGKMTCCTACGQEFILTRDDIKLARPKCLNCGTSRRAKTHQAAQKLAIAIFNKPDPNERDPYPDENVREFFDDTFLPQRRKNSDES